MESSFNVLFHKVALTKEVKENKVILLHQLPLFHFLFKTKFANVEALTKTQNELAIKIFFLLKTLQGYTYDEKKLIWLGGSY